MNKFEEEFKNNLSCLPDNGWIFEANIYRNIKDLDYMCFVEGPTDPDFYNNIKNTAISDKNIRFTTSRLSSSEGVIGNEIGKEGVIKNYYSIFKNSNFKDILSKSIFIVDHDYEGLISEYYEKDEIDNSVFSVTPFYAFENFFLVDENLEKIFKYFSLSNNDLEKFKLILNQFVEECSEYTRLKSSVTIACKKCEYKTYLPSCKILVPYGKSCGEIMKPDHIFHFIFNNSKYHFFNKKFMDMQNEAMLKSIRTDYKIMNYYNNETKKFINNKNFVRGHDVYKLLEQYLLQNYDINISQRKYDKNSRYKEIVKLILVEMRFVNGLGEIIK